MDSVQQFKNSEISQKNLDFQLLLTPQRLGHAEPAFLSDNNVLKASGMFDKAHAPHSAAVPTRPYWLWHHPLSMLLAFARQGSHPLYPCFYQRWGDVRLMAKWFQEIRDRSYEFMDEMNMAKSFLTENITITQGLYLFVRPC